LSSNPLPRPIGRANAQWLDCRVTLLRDLYRCERIEEIAPVAADLTESARAMGYAEVEAAARAVQRLIGDPGSLDAAIEILRRIVKRALRYPRRDAA
jgi:hypothetical protein